MAKSNTKTVNPDGDRTRRAKVAAGTLGALGAIVGFTAGIAAALFSSEHGKVLRSELRAFADKAKGRILTEVANAEKVSHPVYVSFVDEAMKELRRTKRLAKTDLEEIRKDLEMRMEHVVRASRGTTRRALRHRPRKAKSS